jgi:serine/threonine protein kinase
MTDRDKRLDQSAATDQALDDLVCEVSRKLEAGEAVDFEAIAAEHPDHVDRIRELFSTLQAMANLGRPETALPKAPPESHGLGEPNTGILGDFRILREIGRGGMGIIYEAEQLSLHRRMALKVLPFAAVLDRRQLQRFKNEAQAAASLDHPNIVSVHSVGCERGLHYYAMQLIEGQTLAGIIGELGRAAESARKDKRKDEGQSAENVVSRLTQDLAAGQFPAARKKASGDAPTSEFAAEPTPSPVAGDETDRTVQAHVSTSRSIRGRQFFRTVARLGIQAAEALEHAHQMGVVHRDIKPSNLMVDASGHLWVTDFGLAMTKAQTNLTMTGDVVGTLRYMSPEQVQGNRQVMDHRTDLYSLGATLYELLTLRPAVTSNDRHEVIHQIVEEDTRAPRQLSRAIPADLETVVLKAMAKEPKARYATAQEMADDLRRFLEDKPIHARRPTWAQRLAKWSRRHRPILWIVAGAAACVLLAVAIGAALIAHTAELGRQEAEESEQEAEGARQEAEEARRKAEKAQRETARLLAETATLLGASYMDRGQTLCEQREVGRGMVWLARALQVAPDEAPELLEAIRGKLAAWKRRLHSLRMVVQIPGKVRVVALSPDGSRILAGGTDGAVRMWETAKGRPIGTPLQHSSAVTAVAFSPDGSRIVTGTENGTARLWNAATQKPIGKPLVHEGPVVAVAFNRDGSRIATASSHGTIQAWSATDWKPVGEPLKRGWPRSVAFTSAGLRAVITMEGGKHQLWDVDRKEPVGPALD